MPAIVDYMKTYLFFALISYTKAVGNSEQGDERLFKLILEMFWKGQFIVSLILLRYHFLDFF